MAKSDHEDAPVKPPVKPAPTPPDRPTHLPTDPDRPTQLPTDPDRPTHLPADPHRPLTPEEQAAIDAHQEKVVEAFHQAKADGAPEKAPRTKAAQDAIK